MRLTPKILKQVISEAIRDMKEETALWLVDSYLKAKWIWPVPGDTNNPVYNEWDRLEKSIYLPDWNENNETDTTTQIAITGQAISAAIIPDQVLTQEAKDELESVIIALYNKND